MMRLLPLLCFLLVACSGGGLNLGFYPDPEASPQKFLVCHGYGCTRQTAVTLNKKQWASVQKIFKRKSKTAEVERQKIGKAIALMEKYVGEAAGTKDDLAKAPTRRVSFYEQDCIDETVNTTKYLGFLAADDLLKFHDVYKPVYKGGLINGVYPHNSATVIEKDGGQVYVIDSYIYKNGEEPNIRTLESWKRYRVEDLPKE